MLLGATRGNQPRVASTVSSEPQASLTPKPQSMEATRNSATSQPREDV